MNTMKRIFANCIAPCVTAMVLCAPAFAASNGCDVDANAYISPELALCSTHAYNIGQVVNPSGDSNRAFMNEVVALKTTLMTQQMKQQYDYLDATIRRFKTQLEKAVLTTSLQAAGATDDTETQGAFYTSSDKNIVLSGAENCLLKQTTEAGLTCLQNNIRIVLNAVSAGNTSSAYKQLSKDLDVADTYGVKEEGGAGITTHDDCKDLSARKDAVNQCAYHLNIRVMKALEKEQNSRRNQSGQQMP